MSYMPSSFGAFAVRISPTGLRVESVSCLPKPSVEFERSAFFTVWG